jgi:HD-GYP domain-containing protein (c-di-GMP phosphodiesterase class II)
MFSLKMQQRSRPGKPSDSLGSSFRRACVRPVFSFWAKKLFDEFKRHDPATSSHGVPVCRYALRLATQLRLQTQLHIYLTKALLQLRQRIGSEFDPALAAVFVRRLAHYPSSVNEIRAAQNKRPSFFRFSPSPADMPWNRVLQLA